MRTKSNGVDVLAVMESHVKMRKMFLPFASSDPRHAAGIQRHADAVEAHDAVAKLIEAAAEVRAAHRELPSNDHPAEVRQAGEARIGRAHYALEAALARVGGAQ